MLSTWSDGVVMHCFCIKPSDRASGGKIERLRGPADMNGHICKGVLVAEIQDQDYGQHCSFEHCSHLYFQADHGRMFSVRIGNNYTPCSVSDRVLGLGVAFGAFDKAWGSTTATIYFMVCGMMFFFPAGKTFLTDRGHAQWDPRQWV